MASDNLNATQPLSAPALPSDTLPPIPPNVQEIAAPLMFGILIAWLLYGVLIVQVYIYYIFFSDKKVIKAFVYTVVLFDTIQTCMMGADAYYWFCSGFGDMRHLSNIYLSFVDVPILGGLLAFIVQSFFCYRIWVLSKWKVIPVFLLLLCAMATTAAWYSAIKGHSTGNLPAAQAAINTRVLEVWLIGSAIVDTLIAVTLTYLLLRSHGSYKSTNVILQRLIRITMETNMASASLAIISIALYFGKPGTNYFLTPTYYFGKIYANSLLVTLNNRFFIQNSQFGRRSNLEGQGNTLATLARGGGRGVAAFKIDSFNKSVGLDSMEMTIHQESSRKDVNSISNVV